MAKMLIFVIHDPANVDAVVRKWADLGVGGITILDSSGWVQKFGERIIRDDLPLFPSMRRILREEEATNRTIFSVIPDEFSINELVLETEKIVGKLEDPNTGILIALPVLDVYGLRVGEHGQD